ncbi:cyclic AMP-dependent transcription factor ATF-6 alpha [Sabethes cyaneus]|uniref:cyclic AMP-dependent transcription factor ATF-6 alpha n=1 Tax=Sabethes cyaneus TaxID=53552 RepID=UPI00237DBCEF|nr:cyclic AMP-dependent transcription factor ATF-6 alpha [Sabethes cyaneus]
MESQNYEENMLDIEPILEYFPMAPYEDIAPILEYFPMTPYEESQCGTETFDVLESNAEPRPLEEILSRKDIQPASPEYGEFIDPDMFLNGIVKRESESDCSSSSRRNTPSPSDSNRSFDTYPSSGYGSCESAKTNYVSLDSPPVSPESLTSTSCNVVRIGTAQIPIVQKPASLGNLSDLKKIKLPPKGFSSSSGQAPARVLSKGITKKTIVLAAKDYQNLVKNIKNRSNNGTILIKATPASSILPPVLRKPVLPKPAQQPTATVTTLQEKKPDLINSSSSTLEEPFINGPINERIIKRHQRMIKNRESAYLSRVRKKEYVTSLEQRIDVLTKENEYLKSENLRMHEKLKLKCSCATMNTGSMSIISKQIQTSNARKNTAIVLAMLFMVSLNFGPFGNLIGKSSDRAIVEKSAQTFRQKRSLLWLDGSNRLAQQSQNINLSMNFTNLDDLSDVVEEPFSVCPFYVNQTENIRLASELRRWIGENGYKNLTDRDGNDMRINSFSEMFALKDTIDSIYKQMKDISSQMQSFHRKGKAKRHVSKSMKAKPSKLLQQRKAIRDSELAVYYPGFSKAYASFFEEIGRRDDTFYLVSFSGEHLLLPALAYNKTNRPKMSLMLPALMENTTHHSEKVSLMQIDCEVMNTSIIQIREKVIPGDLLRSQARTDDSFAKTNAKQAASRSTTHFSDNNGQNVTTNGEQQNAKPGRRYQNKHHASRPFFVQRMNENMRNELDLN